MKKIKVTQQQRDNLLEALNVMWPSVPEANVSPNLSIWGATKACQVTCGTVACFGGWTESWPPFKEQLANKQNSCGEWEDALCLYGNGLIYDNDNATDLFSPRYCHIADLHFSGSDHALVTNRMKWMLANSKVVKELK